MATRVSASSATANPNWSSSLFGVGGAGRRAWARLLDCLARLRARVRSAAPAGCRTSSPCAVIAVPGCTASPRYTLSQLETSSCFKYPRGAGAAPPRVAARANRSGPTRGLTRRDTDLFQCHHRGKKSWQPA